MTTTNAKPKVILSAYQCGPGMGSVSQIGWHWYSRLAERVPTTLVTHIRNREALTEAGAPLADSEIIYIDTEWFAGPLYRFAAWLFPKSEHAVFLLSSLDFFVYDGAAYKTLKKRQQQGQQWDIVHSVTPVSPNAATRLHKLKYPLVVGPWNGGIGFPKHFPEIMQQDSSWIYPLRKIGKIFNWWYRTTKKSAAMLVANQTTLETIPMQHRERCYKVLENGVDLSLFNPAPYPELLTDQPIRLVFVGRLVPFKGLPMLFEAMGRLKETLPVQLTILGDGPMLAEWQANAIKYGVNEQIHWFGQATPAQVVENINAAHALCLPSVRESGGAVLLEAMACARPILAIAFGGPAEVVEPAVGAVLPPQGRTAVVEALVTALQDMAAHPEAWQQRGLVGRQRAEQHFGWDAKINNTISLYQQLIQN